jgi:uncharacterized protein YutE (UPF0331/DUF86 family)
MVDREVFDRRLSRLESLLRDLGELAAGDLRAFRVDRGRQAQAERWTHLAVECCLDLASHLIADHGWPAPESYRAAFRTLAQEGVIDPDLAEQMAGWAGLRNILVHLYLDIDHDRLHAALGSELEQLARFAVAMQRVLDEDAGGQGG